MTPIWNDYSKLERLFDEAKFLCRIFWGFGFVALVTGGYFVADFAGALFAFGLVSIAAAVGEELKSVVYPIGVLALKRLAESESQPNEGA